MLGILLTVAWQRGAQMEFKPWPSDFLSGAPSERPTPNLTKQYRWPFPF